MQRADLANSEVAAGKGARNSQSLVFIDLTWPDDCLNFPLCFAFVTAIVWLDKLLSISGFPFRQL